MKVEPLHPDFGAHISGVDLTGPLTSELVEQLHRAIDEYSVLLFGDQAMTDDAQLTLTRGPR